jgi:hypothetical protein
MLASQNRVVGLTIEIARVGANATRAQPTLLGCDRP